MDANVIYNILSKLSPKDALRLCATSQKFHKICQNNFIFVRLMKLHYPNMPINEDAKKQFIDIQKGIKTSYTFVDGANEETNGFVRSTDQSKLASMEIPGELDVGKEIWVLCEFIKHNNNLMGERCYPYDNIESALEEGYQLYVYEIESLIDKQMNHLDIAYEEALASLKPSHDIKDEQGIKRFLESDGVVYFYEDARISYDVYFRVFKAIILS